MTTCKDCKAVWKGRTQRCESCRVAYNAQCAKWRADNPESIAQTRARAKTEAGRERSRVAERRRRAANPERERENARRYYRQNRERLLAQGRAWKQANPEKMRAYIRRSQLRRWYGLTPEDHSRLVSAQGGACAICGKKGPLHVDHDHQSGIVRGLLCFQCNVGCGNFEDDPALLMAAIEYLNKASHRGAA